MQRENPNPHSQLCFDRAILKNGRQVPLNVAIQAMASAQASAPAADVDMSEMGSTETTAAGSGRATGPLGGVTYYDTAY